jgi:hypothetical protein
MRPFLGKHPAVMDGSFIDNSNELFVPVPKNGIPKQYIRYRWKDKLEAILGVDLSKKHYQLVKK